MVKTGKRIVFDVTLIRALPVVLAITYTGIKDEAPIAEKIKTEVQRSYAVRIA